MDRAGAQQAVATPKGRSNKQNKVLKKQSQHAGVQDRRVPGKVSAVQVATPQRENEAVSAQPAPAGPSETASVHFSAKMGNKSTPVPAAKAAKQAQDDSINEKQASALPGQTPHRGNNDHISFQEISTDPTLSEILPNAWTPFLPKKDSSDGFLKGMVCPAVDHHEHEVQHVHGYGVCSALARSSEARVHIVLCARDALVGACRTSDVGLIVPFVFIERITLYKCSRPLGLWHDTDSPSTPGQPTHL